MSTTQSKLAAYIGVERQPILTALGLPANDQTGLNQLWEQFAQLAATVGTVGVGKSLPLVAEPPETGDENTYYGLTEQVEAGQGPVMNPQAGVGVNAFIQDSPDLSIFTPGQTGTIQSLVGLMPDNTVNSVVEVFEADTIFSNVTTGTQSRVLKLYQTMDAEEWLEWHQILLYIDDSDGTVEADEGTFPTGWYITDDSLSFVAPMEPGIMTANSAGVYTLDQDTIDAQFYAILTAFTNLYKRGIYSFDGTKFNLELDLTDYSALIEESALEMADLRSRLDAVEAWIAQAESAAGTASTGT